MIPGDSSPKQILGRSSVSPPLRTSSSFRVDEGYSEDMQIVDDLMSGKRRFQSSGDRFILPDWMRALDESVRAEIAYQLVRTLPTSSIANFVERLMPVLHLDFVTILPPELVLLIFSYLDCRSLLNASLTSRLWRKHALEPTLWRNMYKAEGWQYHEKEVRQFEDQLRLDAENEQRQKIAARRYHEELAARASQLSSFAARGSGTGYPYGEMENEQQMRPRQMRFMNTNGFSTFPSFRPSSDEEKLYPYNPIEYTDHTPIVPGLVAPGYGHPKLNWLYLYKQRRRLEDNWVCNRYTNFQIPHPNFPEEGHRECIYTIQYSPNFLISGSRDKTIRKWDIRTRRLIGEPMTGHYGSVLCLQFDESPEEDIVISGSSDSNVIVWQFSTGKQIKTIFRAHQEAILNLRFNKKYLVTCSKDKLIKVWNRVELTTNMPEYPFASKHLFRNNRIVPVPGQHIGAMMQIQDPIYTPISPWSTIQILYGHVAAVNAIQLHGDEIASASGDRVIKIWNINTGNCEKTMIGHSKGIACIQYDGKTVVSGSSDFSIRIFDRASGADIYKLGGHMGLVRTVQASRDRIVSGSYDETVRVWVRRGALRGYGNEGDDPNSFVQAAVLKEGHNPPTYATGYNMGIAAVNGNSLMEIHQAIQNHQQREQQAVHQAQQVQMHQHGQPHHHNLHQTFQQNLLPLPAHLPALTQHIPQNLHTNPQLNALPAGALPPLVPVAQPHAPAHHGNHGGHHHQQSVANNTCKVFKLQFDTRWVICCCQDGKIMGWDFADGELDLMNVCRFFKAD
ncbi:WD40-repeat-containing domain protein [Tirmania nivea]|nr:WD40-repeat-containing domain protein [Tirmania nivea]